MNNECERALKCATELRTQLMNIRLVRQVSIGVTTGKYKRIIGNF